MVYISSMLYSRNIPFWSETLDYYIIYYALVINLLLPSERKSFNVCGYAVNVLGGLELTVGLPAAVQMSLLEQLDHCLFFI